MHFFITTETHVPEVDKDIVLVELLEVLENPLFEITRSTAEVFHIAVIKMSVGDYVVVGHRVESVIKLYLFELRRWYSELYKSIYEVLILEVIDINSRKVS